VDFDLHGRPPFVPPPLLELDEWPPCSLELDLHHFLSSSKGFGATKICVGGHSFSNLVVDGGGAGVVSASW